MKLNDILRHKTSQEKNKTQIGYKNFRFFSNNSRKISMQKDSFVKLIIKYVPIFFVVLLLVILSFTYVFAYLRVNDLRNSGIKDVSIIDPFKYVASAVGNNDNYNLNQLKQTNGRTNILVVGIDSRKDYQSLLTDSIILISYNHSNKKATSISIPRDLRVRYDNNTFTKINSVLQYKFNEFKLSNKNDNIDTLLEKSFTKLENTVEEVLDLDVHYGILINFNAFKEIIDLLGGIDVYVERSFVDHEFPNNNDTALITISFKQGWEKMNGERALQFARSRKGNNGEGTDYARSRRQQIIISAVKQKFLQSDLFTQINNFNSISSILGRNVRFFNFSTADLDLLIRNKDVLKDINLSSIVITPEIGSYPGHILKTGDFEDGIGWVIYPVKADFSELISYVRDILNNQELWEENANVFLGYTDVSSYSSYLRVKKNIINEYKKFEFNDGLIYLNNNLSNQLGISDSKQEIKAYIYVLNAEKKITKEYYYNLIKNLNIEVKMFDIDDPTLKTNLVNEIGEFDILILMN